MKIYVPPIKSQGIKTKLVPWIASVIPPDFQGVWIEPFMGTGVVGFNVAEDALLCDNNPHLIKFYEAVNTGELNAMRVRQYLSTEGLKLLEKGEEHYYNVRRRFNKYHQPLDFLFLTRSCFNGVMRFNKDGEFNVPFCKRPNRFAPAYITKIAIQVDEIRDRLQGKGFDFVCQGFERTIISANKTDIIYCDPPYIGRNTGYFNTWGDRNENALFNALKDVKCRFILSTWHHTPCRANEYVNKLWNGFNIFTCEHDYLVGGKGGRRSPVTEALITNF